MKVEPEPVAPTPLREQHALKCFYLGITEPDEVKHLWEQEVAKRKAAEEEAAKGKKKSGPKPGPRPGPKKPDQQKRGSTR